MVAGVISAVAGGFSSLYIFLPPLFTAADIIIKAAVCIGLVFIAFKVVSFKGAVFKCAVFLAVNAAFAGLTLLMIDLFKIGAYVIAGTVYYDISPVALLVGSAVCYGVITVIQRFFRPDGHLAQKKKTTLYYGGKKEELRLLIDSGNCLKDTVSDSPVIVISPQKAKDITGFELNGVTVPPNGLCGFRLIPCRTVSGHGLLPAFTCERAYIGGVCRGSVIAAVSGGKFDDDFDGIAPPEILETRV
ncbi:MAG: sigma-E processing peptidase SpoIIGA [Oscillospiraceae bacterium]|nr:sigma-E processing peptidase SpoIIGA [Candidatus Equicaccousia limihippi]